MAKTDKNVNATVSITFTGQQAENQIARLEKKADDLRKKLSEAQKALNPDEAQIRKLDSDLKSVEKTLKTVTNQSKKYDDVMKNLYSSTIKQLQQAQRQLLAEIQKLVPGTEEYIAATAKYTKVVQRIRSLQNGYKKLNLQISMTSETVSGLFTRLSGWFQKYFAMTTTLVAGITGISTSFKKCANLAAQLDDTYSDVMKTTGLTRDEVQSLNEELIKMDTRTSREQLNLLARDAGKLGITGKENILGFIRAADKIQVALGEDLGEGAIRELGKIADVFGLTDSLGIEDSLTKVGSAINAVGQASTANEAYLVQFTQRLAGVMAQTNITAANTIGFASAFDQAGVAVEMGTTAFQQFIMKMFTDTATFAKYAKMEVEDFTNLLNTDANAAIVTVLKSLNQAGGFSQMVGMFGDMGADGARAVSALSRVAQNIDAVTEAQALSNIEYEKGTSLQQEFDTKNNNLQAQLDKSKKEFNNAAIALGQSLNPIMLKSTKITTYLIKALANYGSEILAATISIASLVVVLKLKVIWMKLVSMWNGTLRAGTLLLAAAQNLLTGNIHRATAAWRLMSATMKTTALGIVAAAIAGVTMAITHWIKKTREAREAEITLQKIQKQAAESTREEEAEINVLNKILHDNTISYEERLRALNRLKELVPQYHADLTEEGNLINDNKEALLEYVKALRQKALSELFEENIRKMEQQVLNLESKVEEAKNKSDKALMDAGGDATESVTMWGGGMSGAMVVKLTDYGVAIQRVRKAEEELSQVKAEQTKIYEAYQKKIAEVYEETNKKTANDDKNNKILGDFKDEIKKLEQKQEAETNILKKRYYNGIIDQKEYEEQSKDLELRHLVEQYELAKNYSDKKAEYEGKLLDKQIDYKKYAFDRDLKNLEEQQQKEENQIKEDYNKGLINLDEYNEAMADKNIEFLKNKLLLAQKYGQDETKYQAAYLDAMVKQLQQAQDAMGKIEKKSAKETAKEIDDLKKFAEKLLEDIKSPIEKYYDEVAQLNAARNAGYIKDEESYQKALAKIKKKYVKEALDEASDIEQKGLLKQYSAEKSALQQLLKEEMLTREDFEKEMIKLRVKYATQAMEQISTVLNAAGQLVSSMRDAELASAEAQYQADLTAAGDNADEKERIEAEYEQKQLDIKKKYADVDMGISIAKAIAEGALAVVRCWSDLGPVAGPVMAAIVAATTAAQIATIIAQRNAIMATSVSSSGSGSSSGTTSGQRVLNGGMKDGGFAGSDPSDNTPMGIYHANEYVAPAWMVRREPILFRNMEQYRTSGHRPKSFTSGMKEGGYATSPTATPTSGDFNTKALNDTLSKVNATMEKMMAEGVQSFMVYDQFKDFTDTRNRFKKITSRK